MVFPLTHDRFMCCVSRHNNRCKQSVPRFPLYMLWDLILTSYTINSLPLLLQRKLSWPRQIFFQQCAKEWKKSRTVFKRKFAVNLPSLPVSCSTNKLLKTWLGKTKFFCTHFNSKTKQKPATKIQDHVFLLHWRPHAKIQALSWNFFFHPNCHLAWFCTHPFK